MRVDHFAVEAPRLAETAKWYVDHLGASVLYQDETWAFLKVGGSKVALLTPGQHPAHLAFSVTEEELDLLAQQHDQVVKGHRDGTSSIYIGDPSGNAIEFIAYPPGHAYQR